jgi:hypothetical protein
MGARELLADLTRDGFVIEPEGDALLIRPAARLTAALRAAIRTHKPELLALLRDDLASTTAPDFSRRCADCAHRLPRGTCAEPERAGLFPPGHGFGIAWPRRTHAARCPAFDRAPAAEQSSAAAAYAVRLMREPDPSSGPSKAASRRTDAAC